MGLLAEIQKILMRAESAAIDQPHVFMACGLFDVSPCVVQSVSYSEVNKTFLLLKKGIHLLNFAFNSSWRINFELVFLFFLSWRGDLSSFIKKKRVESGIAHACVNIYNFFYIISEQ